MTAYVYALISKTVTLAGGETVGNMTYCYKPYWSGRDADRLNSRMYNLTVARREAKWHGKTLPKYWVLSTDGKFYDGMPVFHMPQRGISIVDDDRREVAGTLCSTPHGWMIEPNG
jgi:hypothetical protein